MMASDGYNAEILVSNSGTVIDKVLSVRHETGGGLNFSVTGQKWLSTEMSRYENGNSDSSIPGFSVCFLYTSGYRY
jgi:hypothetical protein